MADLDNLRIRMACCLLGAALLAGCGDNLGGSGYGAPAVALDRNVVTGPVLDISNCRRFPSRC